MGLFYEVNMEDQKVITKDEKYFRKKNKPKEKAIFEHLLKTLVSFHNPNIRIVKKLNIAMNKNIPGWDNSTLVLFYWIFVLQLNKYLRGVAQMVEHYIRDVGAACSSHVTPINGRVNYGQRIS